MCETNIVRRRRRPRIFQSDAEGCVECDEDKGMICNGGRLTVKEGFWRGSDTSHRIRACNV